MTATLQTDRFDVGGLLGRGGAGTVYEAYDHLLGHRVAVKQLTHLDADGVLHFKQEFRRLAETTHPHVASLYELIADGGSWYFTMELVEGTDLLTHLRGNTVKHDDTLTLCTIDLSELEQPKRPRDDDGVATAATPVPFEKAKPVLAQLAKALHAIHQRGLVHRDIKPGNIMVRPDGHLVLLDFGIAEALHHSRGAHHRAAVTGTPAYMPPEQLEPEAEITPAVDWYSFGVLVYEVLAGHRPFAGSAVQLLIAKLHTDPPSLKQWVPDLPTHVARICERLLSRDPAQRPSGDEILACFGVSPSDEGVEVRETIVGRNRELAALDRAFEQSDTEAVGVFVSGRSGLGKSVLVQSFLETLPKSVLVLRGRCYQQESIPYKGVDSLVDSLADVLPTLGDDVFPEDTAALARTFPTLQTIIDAPPIQGDAVDTRVRGLAALEQLIVNVANKRRLVMFIDDLQWGDTESAPVLARLAANPQAPLLLIATYREEESNTSPTLAAVRSVAHHPWQVIRVGPLDEDAAIALGRALLPDATNDQLQFLARESAGDPYLLSELVRYASRGATTTEGVTLSKVISRRVSQLSQDAQTLLEVVAVAGARIDMGIASTVAGVGGPLIHELRTGHFVRTGTDGTIESYHDKVGETVRASLTAIALGERHLALAKAMDAVSAAQRDPYAVARHYQQSGVQNQDTYRTCREAGELAWQSHDALLAFGFLQVAATTATKLKHPVDPDFEEVLGAAAALAGKLEPAAKHLNAALAHSPQVPQRARAALGLGELYLAHLDSKAAHKYIALALKELGYPVVAELRPKSLFNLVRLWLSGSLIDKEKHPDLWEQARIACRAYLGYGYTSYFNLDRHGLVLSAFASLGIGKQVGNHGEVVRGLEGVAVIFSILGKEQWANKQHTRAAKMSHALADPILQAETQYFRGLSLHFLGKAIQAEEFASNTLEKQGLWLPNADYLSGVADLSWNLLMRGHINKAWHWLELAQKRVSLAGSSPQSEGHTYRCYRGPVLCAMGRVEEGRRELVTYQRFIEEATPDDPWRWLQLTAHHTLFKVIAGELDDEFEALVERYADMKVKPSVVPQQMRQMYVAEAYGRVMQLAASKGDPQAMKQAAEARNRLKKAAKHPTLQAHLAVIDTQLAMANGEDPQPAITDAMSLARDINNPWVCFEIAMLQGSQGLVAARDIAEQSDWPSWKTRSA